MIIKAVPDYSRNLIQKIKRFMQENKLGLVHGRLVFSDPNSIEEYQNVYFKNEPNFTCPSKNFKALDTDDVFSFDTKLSYGQNINFLKDSILKIYPKKFGDYSVVGISLKDWLEEANLYDSLYKALKVGLEISIFELFPDKVYLIDIPKNPSFWKKVFKDSIFKNLFNGKYSGGNISGDNFTIDYILKNQAEYEFWLDNESWKSSRYFIKTEVPKIAEKIADTLWNYTYSIPIKVHKHYIGKTLTLRGFVPLFLYNSKT